MDSINRKNEPDWMAEFQTESCLEDGQLLDEDAFEEERGYSISPQQDTSLPDRGIDAYNYYLDEAEEEAAQERERKVKAILAYASMGYDPSNIAYMCELPEEEVVELLEEEGIEYTGEFAYED